MGLFIYLFHNFAYSQTPFYNILNVTTSDGLSSAVVTGLTQDKYGFIWISTDNGISKYDGYSIKTFNHLEKDSFSLPENLVLGILNSNDNIWIVLLEGLCRYEFATGHFIKEPITKGLFIRKIIHGGDNLYMITQKGLAIFNTKTKNLNFPLSLASGISKNYLQRIPTDFALSKNKDLYYTCDTGLILYHYASNTASLVPLPEFINTRIDKIAIDKVGNFWLTNGEYGSSIFRVDKNGSYSKFPEIFKDVYNNRVNSIFCDSKNRIWVSTSGKGLALYDSSVHHFTFLNNDPLQRSAITLFNISSIIEDSKGTIWVGSQGYGVNYFQPDNTLFRNLLPEYKNGFSYSNSWGRAVAEDKKGNLWLGCLNGLVHYNVTTHTYRVLQNDVQHPQKIYNNSIRALYFDAQDKLWIGTAEGLNRYNTKTGEMDFLGKSNPNEPERSFYKTIIRDHNNNIWFGCRNGIYRYNTQTNLFDHLENEPFFDSLRFYNVQCIYEDSHNRKWIGTGYRGTFIYDSAKHQLISLAKIKGLKTSRSIRSFAEDSDKVWIAGIDRLEYFNVKKGIGKSYNVEQGFNASGCSSLLIDKKKRLWIGTGKGIYVLDSLRKRFTTFSIKDGLPAYEINDQSAFQTSKGEFVYPTLKGFTFFNPNQYLEFNSKVSVFISSFKVYNTEIPGNLNMEELKKIDLNYNQNFFSLGLVGLNYTNPEKVTYAYMLDPFEKEWTYTKDRIVNYTNVPGGDYVFRYKASINEKWDTPEKIFKIHIQRIFYKTIWFWIIVALLLGEIFYKIYRYRLNQTEKIFSLQSKTQLLEKEKAIVQYENLKQQLNPHFLFNSLTSLRSLIRINRESAADFLDKLSLNYRYILKNSDSEIVPLKDELEFARTYIELQKTRFDNGLQVFINVPEEIQYKKIVPVTIQNLIENAIKHNIVDHESPLTINIFQNDDYLVVKNNLQLKQFVETSNKYGLSHLQSLYTYLGARPILIEQTIDSFSVKIPLI